MNSAQIHLALNHAPLFLSVTAGILILTGLFRKNESLKTISLLMLVAAALFTIPVFLTGEGTEELVEHLPGVNGSAIERHEEMARLSLVILAVTGGFALLSLLLRKRSGPAQLLLGISLVLSLVSFGMMAQTAHLGGLVRHSELQTGTTAGNNEQEKEPDDD